MNSVNSHKWHKEHALRRPRSLLNGKTREEVVFKLVLKERWNFYRHKCGTAVGVGIPEGRNSRSKDGSGHRESPAPSLAILGMAERESLSWGPRSFEKSENSLTVQNYVYA